MFTIVADCGFLCLMKTGQPMLYIPSPSTVLHNVKKVFVATCEEFAEALAVGLHQVIYSQNAYILRRTCREH